jgi:hypothetical protein
LPAAARVLGFTGHGRRATAAPCERGYTVVGQREDNREWLFE